MATSGIWCVTRADESYPPRIKNSLKSQAPPVLFGAGSASILNRQAVGIVGSRNIDDDGAGFARRFGELCARSSAAAVSGGARGTDRIAMQGALDAGGCAVGILADSLIKTIRQQDVRNFVADERLVLLTPYRPDNGFSVGGAMGRNKVIYGASDYAVVVSSEYEKGGTWSGAIEALAAGWCPLFVRANSAAERGNLELVKKGGHPVSDVDLRDVEKRSRMDASAFGSGAKAGNARFCMRRITNPPANTPPNTQHSSASNDRGWRLLRRSAVASRARAFP